jgi:SAM-dependent methyltransferase
VTIPPAYFDEMYADSDDPWGFRSRWYEQRKYALTLASLPRQRFRRGYEPGCSIGVLSALLADRCDRLVVSDVADAALAAARERLAGLRSVDVRRLAVPKEWPDGTFDLVVLSELGYYLSRADLAELVTKAAGCLDPDGALVAVHWRHHVEDYPLQGDDVHAAIAADPRLQRLVRHEEDDFLLEVLAPAPARSVAAVTGLVP